jgi:hypothetical protein
MSLIRKTAAKSDKGVAVPMGRLHDLGVQVQEAVTEVDSPKTTTMI